MSKVLVDRELLCQSLGGGVKGEHARSELRGMLSRAQPAEAEGVEVVAYAYIDETPEDYLRTKPFVMFAGPDGGAPGPAMAHQRLEALVRLSALQAVTAELTAAGIAYRIRGDVIAELIAERDRLRKENERLKRAAQTNWNEFADSVGERDQLRAEVAALRKDADRWNLYRQGFSNPEVMEANADAQIKCLKRAAMAAKEGGNGSPRTTGSPIQAALPRRNLLHH